MNSLAKTLLSQDKVDEASLVFKKVDEIARRTMKEGDYMRAVFDVHYGECLIKQKMFALAEEHLLSGHQVFSKLLGEEHRSTREAQKYILDLYKAWGKPEEAERIQKEGIDKLASNRQEAVK